MSEALRILLLGGTGQIGSELTDTLTTIGQVRAPDRAELDVTRLEDVEALIAAHRPHCIVNAAAYTAVDDAERERAEAELLNARLPAQLASSCECIGASLVHYSTDYVFSGDAVRPYREDDATGPLSWYGETKLAGERAITNGMQRGIILRTGWIYGATGRNFYRTMLRLARENEEIRVVDDQYGAPTWARQVALATTQLVGTLGRDAASWREGNGVYHMSADGVATWHGFAERLIDTDPRRAEHVVRKITAIATREYPTAARRPAYSVLDCSALEARFGIRLPAWETQLEHVQSERR